MATYSLTIGNTSGISFNTAKSITFGSTSYDVNIKTLRFSKQIYQPCEIQLTLVVKNNSGFPTSTLIQSTLLKQLVSLSIGGSTVASNYFVQKVKPIFGTVSGSTTLEVELSIFSLDKLMTFDKYSKAHTAEKLGATIFKNMVGKFKLGSTALTGDCSKLQMLKMSDGELRIPYAVQFNESFYDFLARIANRYGEFLYFENGKLNLGMEPTTTFYSETNNNTSTTIQWDEKCKSYYFESAVESCLDVSNQYNDYMVRKNKNSNVYAISETKDSDGNTIATYDYYNADIISSNEYLTVITKDKYATLDTQYQAYEKFIMEDIYKFLSGTSLARILANIAVSEAQRLIKAGIAITNLNAKNEKTNFAGFSGDTYKDQRDSDGKNLTQFATYAASATLQKYLGSTCQSLNDQFYQLIKSKEKAVDAGKVCLEFEGNSVRAFMLGDKIQVANKDYIIIAVENYGEISGTTYIDKQRVTAVPIVITGSCIPCLLPQEVKKVEPQRAYIAESFDPDKLGRVRIRYPWQFASDAASPWIRVSLPFATNGGAVNFCPNPGDEVMVGYEFGNIDKPYVMGYLESPYGKQKWTEDSLPFRGIKSKNGHSLIFDDPLDGANFFWGWVPLMKTLKSFLPNSCWKDFLKNEDQGMVDLTGSTTITDRYGLYKISGSSDGRNVTIQSPMGDVKIDAFTGISINAPNGDIKISGKNVSIKAANNLTLESGSNLKNKFVDINEDPETSLAKALRDEVSSIVEKALDMTFLRCVFEVFLRPIDGTLKIKSSTFVMVEAGPGKVEVPRGSYTRDPSRWKQDHISDADATAMDNLWPKVKNTLDVIIDNVNAAVDRYAIVYKNLYEAIYAFNTVTETLDANHQVISFAEILTKAKTNHPTDSRTLSIRENDIHSDAEVLTNNDGIVDEPEEPKRDDYDDERKYQRAMTLWGRVHARWVTQKDEKKAIIKESIIAQATNVYRALNNLYLEAKHWKDTLIMGNKTDDDVFMPVLLVLKNHSDLCLCPIKLDDAINMVVDDKKVVEQVNWTVEKKILKRKIAYELLTKDNVKKVFKVKNLTEPSNYASAAKWKSFVDAIFVDDSLDTAVVDWFIEHYGKNFTDLADIFYRNETWKTGVKGQILFSDNPAKTISFTRNGMSEGDNLKSISTRYDTEIKRILGDL